MIQDYRNQGIPSHNLQLKEGIRFNSENELKKIVNQERVNTHSKSYLEEPCVTDYFYRNKVTGN